MANDKWVKIKQEYSSLIDTINQLIQNAQISEKEYWNDVKKQLQDAKKEAEQKIELLENETGEVSEYIDSSYDQIIEDLSQVFTYIKEKYDLGDSNETGS